jgi:hypothetical protein
MALFYEELSDISAPPTKLDNHFFFVFASYVYSQPSPYLEGISICSLRMIYCGGKRPT